MNLDIQQVLTQIIAFLIFFWILKKFAWKPLLGLMEERQRLIRSELDAIEKQKQEVAGLAQDYQAKLRDIESESRKKIQEAIDKGREAAHEIEQETRRQAAEVFSKAQEEIKHELAQAKVQLKNDMVKISLAATQKLIQDKLDLAQHRELIEEAIDQAEL